MEQKPSKLKRIMAYSKKLINIQVELKAPKNIRNEFGEFNYRQLEDILEKLKPLLLKYECNIHFNDKLIPIVDSEGKSQIWIQSEVVFNDGETTISSTAHAPYTIHKKMSGEQMAGTASSYARKYAISGLLCLGDSKDADSHPPPSPDALKPNSEIEQMVKAIITIEELSKLWVQIGEKGRKDKANIALFAKRRAEIEQLKQKNK